MPYKLLKQTQIIAEIQLQNGQATTPEHTEAEKKIALGVKAVIDNVLDDIQGASDVARVVIHVSAEDN